MPTSDPPPVAASRDAVKETRVGYFFFFFALTFTP